MKFTVHTTPPSASEEEIMNIAREILDLCRGEKVVALSFAAVVDRGGEWGQDWNHYCDYGYEEELEEVTAKVLDEIEAEADKLYEDIVDGEY